MNTPQQPADGKWVDGLTPETPAGEAARRVLSARCAAVVGALESCRSWGADPEPVHRLRVATRRAAAALEVFADLLPSKAYRKGRRILKRLRRAAAVARDLDVLLDAVRTWSVHQSPAARPGLHFLLGHAFAGREAAQAVLTAAIGATSDKDVARLSGLAGAVRDGKQEALGERAVSVVSRLVHDLEVAAQADLDDYRRLHEIRILGKRLRYALELFVDCFPAAAREQVYPHIEAVQDILGAANDSFQAGLRLEGMLQRVRLTQPGLWELLRPGLEEYHAYHQTRLKGQRATFGDWWRQWRALDPETIFRQVRSKASSAGAAEAPRAPTPGGP